MLEQLIVPVDQAGQELLRAYADSARASTRSDMHSAGTRLEEIADEVLKPALAEIRPGARWAGVLLITEAGGVVTDLRGEPWQPGHPRRRSRHPRRAALFSPDSMGV